MHHNSPKTTNQINNLTNYSKYAQIECWHIIDLSLCLCLSETSLMSLRKQYVCSDPVVVSQSGQCKCVFRPLICIIIICIDFDDAVDDDISAKMAHRIATNTYAQPRMISSKLAIVWHANVCRVNTATLTFSPPLDHGHLASQQLTNWRPAR